MCLGSTNFEKNLAKLYLFLLPVRMISPLLGFANLFHGAAVYFDFILNILGILIYLFKHKFVLRLSNDNGGRAFNVFFCTVFFLNLMSLVMAFITQVTQGSYAGETAFSGILGMEIYFFQYVLILAYNRHIFHILSEEEIKRVISKTCFALMILGYFQVLILLFGGAFRTILETIDIFDILWPDNSMWKLSLTGREGASAGTIFGVFVLPYLLGQLLDKNWKNHTLIILQLVLWIPLVIFMQSSSAYLMTFSVLFGFVLYKFSYNKRKKIKIILLSILVLILIIPIGNKLIDFLPPEIRYLIFYKVRDMENGSTIARIVPFVTNWNTFLQSPIFGVGNGLQGYYYVDFFPDWARNVAGSDVMNFYNTAQNQIINGGLFFPGFLSGYGLVGVLLFINIVFVIKRRLHDMKKVDTFAYNFFRIAAWSIVICGFQSEFAGNYLIWFVIGLPFMDYIPSPERRIQNEKSICDCSISRL